MGQLQPRTGCPTRSDVRSEGAARVRRSTPSRLRPLAEAEERSCWCHTARRPLRRQLWHTARHLGSRRRGRRWLTVVAAEEALRRRRCGGGCCGGGCCGGRSRRRALAADHARGWAPETKGRDSRPRLRAGFFSPRRLAAHLHGQVAVFVLSLSGPSENGTVGLSVDPEKTGPSVDISCFQLFVYFRSSVSLSQDRGFKTHPSRLFPLEFRSPPSLWEPAQLAQLDRPPSGRSPAALRTEPPMSSWASWAGSQKEGGLRNSAGIRASFVGRVTAV